MGKGNLCFETNFVHHMPLLFLCAITESVACRLNRPWRDSVCRTTLLCYWGPWI